MHHEGWHEGSHRGIDDYTYTPLIQWWFWCSDVIRSQYTQSWQDANFTKAWCKKTSWPMMTDVHVPSDFKMTQTMDLCKIYWCCSTLLFSSWLTALNVLWLLARQNWIFLFGRLCCTTERVQMQRCYWLRKLGSYPNTQIQMWRRKFPGSFCNILKSLPRKRSH